MPFNENLIYAYMLLLAFALSAASTEGIRRTALRWGVLDQPGGRKAHRDPTPLMGGVAIIAVFYLMVAVHLLAFALMDRFGTDWLELRLADFLGEGSYMKLAGLLAGGIAIFTLGVVDDVRPLGPWPKLLGQITAAALLVLGGNRITLFIFENAWLGAIVTIIWVVLIINSLNFLDNMDGLCGGVAVIAAFTYFISLQGPHEQLARALLVIFAGAVAGFLYHNLNPARIFMGDAGSMFIGYILAAIAVIATFHVEETPTPVAVAAPVLALSVPLFDTFTVLFIRWRSGVPLMQGDKRHFSHRLVALGMSPRQAVEFIYLVAAVVGLGGALLPLLGWGGVSIILGQTAGVFLLIALLMRAGWQQRDKATHE